jgi:hypothetical protein
VTIRFFFEFDKEIIQLPVNPEEIKVVSSGNNSSEEIVALGEITILREKKLREIKVESFLPLYQDAPYVLTKGKFKPYGFYVKFFNKIINAKKPLRLIVTGVGINMLMSIENMESWKKGGDNDLYFSLDLKEYRTLTVKTAKNVTTTSTISNTPTVSTVSTVPTTYVGVITPPANTTKLTTGFSIGNVVLCTGKYYYTSYGAKPFGTFTSGFRGKISHIVADTTRKYRYHITNMSGGYLGWVEVNQITHA